MSFRLVKKIGDLERRNGPYMRYFTEFVFDVVVKQFFHHHQHHHTTFIVRLLQTNVRT